MKNFKPQKKRYYRVEERLSLGPEIRLFFLDKLNGRHYGKPSELYSTLKINPNLDWAWNYILHNSSKDERCKAVRDSVLEGIEFTKS